VIAHEIGHALGLANEEASSCSTSIMNGHQPGNCEQLVKNISAGDVDAVRKHAANRMNCEAQSSSTIFPHPEISPTPTPTPTQNQLPVNRLPIKYNGVSSITIGLITGHRIVNVKTGLPLS
jgi:hypothetical protein